MLCQCDRNNNLSGIFKKNRTERKVPMEVLMDHYWKKSYAKKIPEFIEYERWQNGELDEEWRKILWQDIK